MTGQIVLVSLTDDMFCALWPFVTLQICYRYMSLVGRVNWNINLGTVGRGERITYVGQEKKSELEMEDFPTFFLWA